MFDLAAVRPKILPQAIDWVESCSKEILTDGQPLTVAGASSRSRSADSRFSNRMTGKHPEAAARMLRLINY